MKRSAQIVASGMVVLMIARAFVVQGAVIRSTSMTPSLLPGDVVLVNRAATGGPIPATGLRLPGYASVQRCDIVFFQLAGAGGVMFAKRVVGVSGDTIAMRKQALYRNGAAVSEVYLAPSTTRDQYDAKMAWQRPYLVDAGVKKPYSPTRDNWGPLVVPPGKYFVLGDERDGSLDSRFWGFLDIRDIRGRAVAVYFSKGNTGVRWSRIGAHLGCQNT